MLARGGTLILYIRVYMNYNGVFGKNIASTILHCIIEKLYTETPNQVDFSPFTPESVFCLINVDFNYLPL